MRLRRGIRREHSGRRRTNKARTRARARGTTWHTPIRAGKGHLDARRRETRISPRSGPTLPLRSGTSDGPGRPHPALRSPGGSRPTRGDHLSVMRSSTAQVEDIRERRGRGRGRSGVVPRLRELVPARERPAGAPRASRSPMPTTAPGSPSDHGESLRRAWADAESGPAGGDAAIARCSHQQEHFDWYADNPLQTYAAVRAASLLEGAGRDHVRALAAADPAGRERCWTSAARRDAARSRSPPPAPDVVAFDISKRARRPGARARRANRRPRPSHVPRRGRHELPFRDESFDYVLTYGVLHHLPEPRHVCEEIGRVLKPGGIVLLLREQPHHPALGVRAAPARGSALARGGRRVRPDLAGAALGMACQRRPARVDPHERVPPSTPAEPRSAAGRRARPRWTDALAGVVPGLRGNGGLVVAEAVKPVAAR